VLGALRVLGTAFEPVVFTSLEDDAIDGDTNADGAASSPAPGDWQTIQLAATATGASLLENVLVRFAGGSGLAALDCDSPDATLRSVRVEHAYAGGFELSALASAALNLVAFDCGGDGILADVGSFHLIHATSVGNSNGFRALAGYGGTITNSIGWGNTVDDFAGLSAGSVTNSNGSASHAGSNGNIDQDPLFVDASTAVGDLRLTASSPCIDTAGPAGASLAVKDHREHSRSLDPTLSGTALPDMGAYEHAAWEMTHLSGQPRIGDALVFRVDGPAASSLYVLGLLDGTTFAPPFGFLTAGTSSVRMIGSAPVGTKFRIGPPHDLSLVGLAFGVQTLTKPTGSPSVGAWTNLYRARLGPPRADRRRKIAVAPELEGTLELNL